MATPKLSKRRMWQVTASSKTSLTQTERDFVAELVSEEARKTPRKYSFVLHDMVESEHYCKLYVEASQTALVNLLAVMESNLPHKVVVADLGERNSAEQTRPWKM
jgi:hypothetical protein